MQRHETGIVVDGFLGGLQHLGALLGVGLQVGLGDHLVDVRVAVVAGVVLTDTAVGIRAEGQEFEEVGTVFGVRVPTDHHHVGGTRIIFRPVLGLGQGLQVHRDVDLGQHRGDGLGDLGIVHIAVVGRHHADLEAILVSGFLHQLLGLGHVIAWGQLGVVALIAIRRHLGGGGREAFHQLLGDAFLIDGVVDGLTDALVLEGFDTLLVHLEGDDAGAAHLDQVHAVLLANAFQVGRRYRRDEVHVAGEQRRDTRGVFLDRCQHDVIDVTRRFGIPVILEALETDLHALLTVRDLVGARAGLVA